MAMRDEDFGAALTLTEGDNEVWSPPMAAPASAPRDWQALYEQAQARADAAEARCEELLVAERTARSRAGSLKWALDKSRTKLEATVEEVKEVRRAAKDALFFPVGSGATGEAAFGGRRRFAQAQHDRGAAHGSLPVEQSPAGVGGPEGYGRTSARRRLPSARGCAGVGSREGHDQGAARGSRFPEPGERPAAQGPGAIAGAERRARGVAQEGRGASWQVETSGTGFAAPARQCPAAQGAGTRAEAEGHGQGAARGSRFPEPGDPPAEPGGLPAAPRAGRVAGPQGDRALDDRRGRDSPRRAGGIPRPNARHRWAEDARPQSGDRPAAIRSQGRAGGRVRRASSGVRALRKTARPGQDHRVAAQGERTAGREDKVPARPQSEPASPDCPAPLDASRVVEGGLRGRSERQETPRSDRGRGQQRGASGHGRTPRPALEEREERQEPPEEARVCSCCGKPYVANGEHSSSVIEIAVKAHIRRIVRPRYRRGCDCASSAPEVTAPPPARLFPRTPYGTSVWARILYERFTCFGPCARSRRG